jgi:hypothetical protein
MTANSIVGINALNKWYGDFHVLRDINLDVAKGERIVICGPRARQVDADPLHQRAGGIPGRADRRRRHRTWAEPAAGGRSPARGRHGVPELSTCFRI